MSRRPDRVPEPAAQATRGPLERIEQAALLVLLALIPLRAVTTETHVFEVPRWFRALPGPAGSQPGTTLLIIALIVTVAAVLAGARFIWGGPRYLRTGAKWGTLLLAIAALISTWQAGQKHLAWIGTLDFLAMVVYMLTLRQLLTRPWHIRVALTVILATGAMVIAKCGYQHWVELPQTIQYYEEHKAELVQGGLGEEQGSQGAGFLHDYEQRLRSGLVTGYFTHSNVLGSYLVMVMMASLAVFTSRYRRRPAWTLAVPLLLIFSGAAAVASAQSKGAIVACAAALVMWAVIQSMVRRQGTSARLRTLWVLPWIIFAIGACTVVAVLKTHPDALGKSMQYRSMYWQGAWRMLLDQGPWGVGANNFGRHFPRYKSVECPEDVESPHSWPVQAATEWGLLGLAGLAIMLLGVTRRLALPALEEREKQRCESETGATGPGRGVPPAQTAGSTVLWMAGTGAVFLGWTAVALRGSESGFVQLTLLVAAVPWGLGFWTTSIETTRTAELSDDHMGPMLPALCAGLFGFLLHTGIDLALFHPGAAMTFFAMMAIALASRDLGSEHDQQGSTVSNTAGHRRRKSDLVLALGGTLCILLMMILLVIPASHAGSLLRTARLSDRPPSWQHYFNSTGYRAYTEAIDRYPLDVTAAEELADELISRVRTVEHVDHVHDIVDQFRRRDPANTIGWHQLATLAYQKFELTRDSAHLQRAIDCMAQAVDAYPTSPTKRLLLADLFERLAAHTGSAAARTSAIAQLQQALDLDAGRVYVSKPHRFTDAMRTEFTARIARIRSNSEDPPTRPPTPDP